MGELHQLIPQPRQPDVEAAARRQRAEAVRKMIKDRPGSLPGTRDHAYAAGEELFRLISPRGRDFKRRIAEAAFGTAARVPTKRLYDVLIDPEKPREMNAERAVKRARLTIHLRVASAFAMVSGQHESDVILQVFRGLADTVGDAPPVHASSLADAMRDEVWAAWLRATETIIADCDLRRALTVAMEYRPEGTGPLPRFRLDFGQVIGAGDLIETAARKSAASPHSFVLGVAPHLFLGECHGPTFRATVAPLGADGVVGSIDPGFACWVRLWLRFWWAILPIGADASPRGCFLVTLATERAPVPIAVTELDEWQSDETPLSPEAPWPQLLGAAGARADFHWTDRNLWERRNAPGLVLNWDMPGGLDLREVGFPDAVRCAATPDAETLRMLWAVFGLEVEALPANPVRILPPTAQWSETILTLPDGSLSGCIGTDPDEPSLRPPPEPQHRDDATDAQIAAAEDTYNEAMARWRDAEIAYQAGPSPYVSGPTNPRSDRLLATPAFGQHVDECGSMPTFGSKLEHCLFVLPDTHRPDLLLREQAERLREHAVRVTGRIAAARRTKLAVLGRRGS